MTYGESAGILSKTQVSELKLRYENYIWKTQKRRETVEEVRGDENFQRKVRVEVTKQDEIPLMEASVEQLQSWFTQCVEMIEKGPSFENDPQVGRLEVIDQLYSFLDYLLAVDYLFIESGSSTWNQLKNLQIGADLEKKAMDKFETLDVTLGTLENWEAPHKDVVVRQIVEISKLSADAVRTVNDPRITRNFILSQPVNFTDAEIKSLREKYGEGEILRLAPNDFRRFKKDKVPYSFRFHEYGYTLTELHSIVKVPNKSIACLNEFQREQVVHTIVPNLVKLQEDRCKFWFQKSREILEVAGHRSIEIEDTMNYKP